jgi:hypothetical protein
MWPFRRWSLSYEYKTRHTHSYYYCSNQRSWRPTNYNQLPTMLDQALSLPTKMHPSQLQKQMDCPHCLYILQIQSKLHSWIVLIVSTIP